MTVCVAALCDGGSTIVLVADKMIGMEFVETEPEIQKIIKLHKDWWMMFAGDVPPVFDITDQARAVLPKDSVTTTDMIKIVTESYQRKRLRDAETLYLKTRGYTIDTFRQEGVKLLPPEVYRQIDFQIEQHSLGLTLLVAGFDDRREGRIFSVRNPGHSIRHDIPGFHAIGSGDIGALYMLYHRSMSPTVQARVVLYGAFEAKYFAEQATGVGTRTDIYIVRPDQPELKIDEETTIDEKLVPICEAVQPASLKKRHLEILNAMGELHDFTPIDIPAHLKRQNI